MLAKTMSVSEITGEISSLIDFDLNLKNVAVEGQISNLSRSSAGHFYFNLIDEKALIKCVFFRGMASRNKIELKEGESIIVCGNVQVYKMGGYHQIVVTRVLESKESYMHRLFLELKAKLEKKGYFLQERKRALPTNIRKVGLVTSKTSAAIKDFLTSLNKRNPFIEVYLIDVRVQGKTAAEEVANAINQFQEYDDIDVLVVTRGGGSKDELFLFNDESICEAAYHSKIPVLSAVGHEIDKCLLDFTADIYASTPSQAAQIISDSMYVHVNTLPLKIKSLVNAFNMRFSYEKMTLDAKLSKIENFLIAQIRQGKSSLNEMDRRLGLNCINRINNDKLKLEQSLKLLESYNVNNVLKRGFSILRKDGQVLGSYQDFNKDDMIAIELADFIVYASVHSVEKKDKTLR